MLVLGNVTLISIKMVLLVVHAIQVILHQQVQQWKLPAQKLAQNPVPDLPVQIMRHVVMVPKLPQEHKIR